MQCLEIQQQLNALCDGERLSPLGRYRVGRHCLSCAECRATGRQLRQLRHVCQTLPSPPAPARLTESVPVVLPRCAPPVPALVPTRRPMQRPMVRIAGVLALLLVGLTAVPWRRDRPVGAAVEAAVKGANTWHLKGWKLRDGQRIPWEIWGRRTPFFYREQIGDELNFDDGSQRVRLVPTGGAGKWTALRLASGPAPSDQWREWLTMGIGWRSFHRAARDADEMWLLGGTDSGMQGPYSVAQDYFRVDKRTWLPVEWGYRLRWSNSNEPER